MPTYSDAATDLGLGDMLAEQVEGETEEQRKKRMAELQQQQQTNGFEGSAAVESLLGATANQMLIDRSQRGLHAENIQQNRNSDLRTRSLKGILSYMKRSREAP